MFDDDGVTRLFGPGVSIRYEGNAFAVADRAKAGPQSAAIFVIVTPSSRRRANAMTSSRNSLGEGAGMMTFSPLAPPRYARSIVSNSFLKPGIE